MLFAMNRHKTKAMKRLFLFFITAILGFSTFAQEIDIPAEQYPFYSILEWKGMGSILLNRDPSGNQKKVNLTLIGSQNTSVWQESFNPNGKDFYYIASENARYTYFLDNLNPELGKVSMHQISSAGNVKSTSVGLTAAIKKLGAYDISEMQLIDVVTTDKALVHIFRYKDSKEKKYTEIATFITHHNFLVYAAILGDVPEVNLKDPNYGQWKYIGFTDDQICFAARDYQDKNKGWSVKTFTSKGALTSTQFIQGLKDNFDFVEHAGMGTNGKTYLQNNADSETALLTFLNNQFYLLGLQTEGTSKIAKLKQLKEGEWVDLKSHKFAMEPSKKPTELAIYPLNEGFGCKIGGTMVFLPFAATSKPIQNKFKTEYHSNPSRFILEDKKELFAVSLADGNLFFDLNQLNKPGNVKFEFIKK